MPPVVDALDALDAELSRLSTIEAKLDAISRWSGPREASTRPAVLLFSDGKTGGAQDARPSKAMTKAFSTLLSRHGITPQMYQQRAMQGDSALSKHILETLPCAHVVAGRGWKCAGEGKLTCSSCKLVRYCSKNCQTEHWKIHKKDCKDEIRSEAWRPAWIRERRSPAFMTENHDPKPSDPDWRLKIDNLAFGISLWGNLPAFDVLDKRRDAKEAQKQDLDLAFVASGDLRNMILSVNALPLDYAGRLTITLNDQAPMVVLRNALLLSLLGRTRDVSQAADVALHSWYSAFIPIEYQLQVLALGTELLAAGKQGKPFDIELGAHAIMKTSLDPTELAYLARTMTSKYTAADVNQEMHRVRFANHRRDYWDKHLSGLEPTHRLAFTEYRRFGLVYPFSAANYHFNTPNRFLFTPEGRWMQTDYANPLEAWDIPAVLEAGKRHGATHGDLFGCLYFYLQDQLRAFAERLSRFTVTFHVFCMDARVLAQDIRSGKLSETIPSSIVFDRVEVSNTLDSEYIGVSNILDDWAPFLKRRDDAAIVGSFMNWMSKQPGSQASNCENEVLSALTAKMAKDGRIVVPPSAGRLQEAADEMMMMMSAHLNSCTAYLDTSVAFKQYLRRYGMDDALKKHRVQLRSIHNIVPHRLCTSLDGAPDALPQFADKDEWYVHANLGSWTWSERFVEIVRKI